MDWSDAENMQPLKTGRRFKDSVPVEKAALPKAALEEADAKRTCDHPSCSPCCPSCKLESPLLAVRLLTALQNFVLLRFGFEAVEWDAGSF